MQPGWIIKKSEWYIDYEALSITFMEEIRPLRLSCKISKFIDTRDRRFESHPHCDKNLLPTKILVKFGFMLTMPNLLQWKRFIPNPNENILIIISKFCLTSDFPICLPMGINGRYCHLFFLDVHIEKAHTKIWCCYIILLTNSIIFLTLSPYRETIVDRWRFS